MLIVISGLPGTGKTAVAARLAIRMNAVHLSIDSIEDAILGAGMARGWKVGVAAYEATRAAAEQTWSSVGTSSWTRSTTAAQHGRPGAMPPTARLPR